MGFECFDRNGQGKSLWFGLGCAVNGDLELGIWVLIGIMNNTVECCCSYCFSH